MDKVIVGVDIAKDTFEAAFLAEGTGRVTAQRSYPNTCKGHKQLIRQAACHDHAHVVMEATGNYHRRLSKALLEADLLQSIVNPLQVKRFGQMKLRRHKTDKSDAVLLAQYGHEQKPSSKDQPREPAQEQIKQINTLIEQLTKQQTALKNQQHAASQLPDAAGVCEEVLQEQLRQVEKSLQKLKAEQERLARQEFTHVKELAESVVGVGTRTTCTLIAYAGDLSSFDTHKQLSAFMGMNPVVRQSGQLEKAAHISKQGHKRLRTLFYMAAQSARRYNNACRALYERLIRRGKAKKVALIAVANKLVKQVFAVVKSQTLFDNDYYYKHAPSV